MSNSILSLIFPISDDKCLNTPNVESQNLYLPLQTDKIFSASSHLGQSQLCTIVTKEGLKKHARSLLFQSYVSKAKSNESTTIVTFKAWEEVPFDVQSRGVFGMPKLELCMFDRLTFVFPKSIREVFLYLSALGGLEAEDLPGLIVIENIDEILSKNPNDGGENRGNNQARLTKLLSMLANLSREALKKKFIQIIVTFEEKSFQFSLEKCNIWCDEIWALGIHDDGEQNFTLKLCGNSKSSTQLRLTFEPITKLFHFSSLILL